MQKVFLLAFLLAGHLVYAQETTISGTVTEADNNAPIIGATIMVKDAGIGTITDLDGRYELPVPVALLDNGILVVSYVGFMQREIPIAGNTEINVQLSINTQALSEVVITAVGIERDKRELGYAVESVGGDELAGSRETNVVNALNAKVAGVQITSSSGGPGASASIRIRGNKSVNGSNEPLFIVDGFPVDNSYRGSNFTDFANRLIDLNPEDIEEITILKGPAATALYGIKAANGAVVITTRKGKQGKTQINYSTTFTVDMVNKLPGLQDKYSQGTNGKYRNPGGGFRTSWGALIDTLRFDGATDYPYDPNGAIVGMSSPSATDNAVVPYDNAAAFFEPGFTYNNYLSISTGNEKSNVFFSAGNTRQTGIVPTTSFEKTSFKLTGSSRVYDKITLTASANYIKTNSDMGQRGSNLSGVMLSLMRTPPTFDITNGSDDPVNDPAAYQLEDGTQRTYFNAYDNPYWSVNKNKVFNNVDRLISFAEAVYPVNDWLRFTYRAGIDFYAEDLHAYWDNESNEFGTGRLFDQVLNQQDFNSDFIMSISKQITKDLDLDIIAGHNYYSHYVKTYEVEGYTFVLPGFYDISNINQEDITLVDDYLSRQKQVGVYGEVKLGFRSYLYTSITGRNDWASTLPAGNNSFFYPGVSAGFIFTDAFDIRSNVLNDGKIRASWSQAGNDSPFEYATGNYFGAGTPSQGLLSFAPFGTVGNNMLRPEQTVSVEIGTDLHFYNNRINLDVTYYNESSKDQIISVPIPPTTGYTSIILNAGEITNKGIEVMLDAMVVDRNNFRWSVDWNFARNRNNVVALLDSVNNIALPSFGLSSTSSRVIVGQPYGVLFGTVWQRDENGNILVDDNGYPIVAAESGIVGDPNPDWISGLRNTFRYKSWSLTLLVDVRMGGDVYNGTVGVMKNLGTHESTLDRDESVVWDGVYASSGEVNTTPITLGEDFYDRYPLAYVSEAVVEDASWLRFRELNLGYNLPAGFVNRLKLQQASITLTARNLLLFTNYSGIDPETNLSGAANSIGRDYFNMPNTRSIGLNLNVIL